MSRGAPPIPDGKLVLLRHGETEWSKSGQHTGLTDIPLTAHGEVLAKAAGALLTGYDFTLVLSSPLVRARHTAELAGLRAELDADLLEWDYGGYEGRTTADIRRDLGYDWAIFRDGVVPGQTPGETVEEVAARASRILRRTEAALLTGDVALVAHGHYLRIFTTVFLRQEPRMAAKILLDAGSVSVLQYDREQPAIRTWNRLPVLPHDSLLV